jgi:hypothetical protein
MEERNQSQSFPPVRRRKRKPVPKWKRLFRKYWPPVRFGLIIVAFLAVVIWGISAIAGGIRVGSTGQAETGSAVETTTEPTLSQEEIRLQAEALMKDADFIAAGYDYEKAITMLREFEYFDMFPEMATKIEEYRELDSQLVVYQDMGKITHIFFHSLIVDPSLAFDGDEDQNGYHCYMNTIDEFWKMMEIMYERGFVLVTPYQVAYEVESPDGNFFTYGKLRLPEGKKPFIMSQDDVNYYSYMIGTGSGINETPIFADTHGDGFANKIVIGEDGYPTCEYMDQNGNVTTGDYDLVPLLEKFIQLHPDFAYHGARAVLGMTGYEGVFGYRTKPSYEAALGTERYQQEVAAAKEVAQCLRDHGWILASHSYGHPSYGRIGDENVRVDSDKWEATVESIIGEVDIILYPNGSDIAGAEAYDFDNAKFDALYEDCYRYFFNVDSSVYWSQLGANYYRGGRRNPDGYRMWHQPQKLEDLFNVEDVYDKSRPDKEPKI